MTTKHWISMVAMLAWTGCRSAPPSPEGPPPGPPPGGEQLGTAETMTNVPDAGAQDAAPSPPPPAPPPVTVVPGTPTPIPANLHPRVQIIAPRDNAVVRTNRVEVRLRVTDWPAPQEGRHIHLILDNEPYRRIDDPSRPIPLENLSEGTHLLRAFPGWSTHESVKTEGAFSMVVFHVGRRTENFGLNRTAPLLTYSRPKGDYNGPEAERILLDFYITNVPGQQLSPTGYRVRYAIDGTTTGEITSWVPHYIEHLPDGAHTVMIELLGPDGQPVQNLYNRTERTINVNHGAAASTEHTHSTTARTTNTDAGSATTDAAR